MRYSALAAAGLVLTLAIFGFSDADLAVQSLFFDPRTGGWLLDKQEPVLRLVFYSGPKVLLILFAVACLLALLLSRRFPWAARRRQGLVLVVLSAILVPLLVNGLKTATNVACPSNLEAFGGPIPYVHLFEPYPPGERPAVTQRCFPCSHATVGFALFSLIALAETRRGRRAAAAGALAAGSIAGLYKMLIGDHFLSHVLVTLWLSLLLIELLWLLVRRIVPDSTA